MAQMLTANRLVDGDVLYWRGGQWVEAFCEGEVFDDKTTAEAALAAAQRFVAENIVVNPYLFDMKGDLPLKEREIIRALGPSVRRDVGKQAGERVPGFAQQNVAEKPGQERNDDVSI